MKRTVSVTALLNGNSRKKVRKVTTTSTSEVPLAGPYGMDSQLQGDTIMQDNEEETIESIEISSEMSSSPLKTSQPTPTGKAQQSVQSFLMSRRSKKSDIVTHDDVAENSIIISLDNDCIEETHLNTKQNGGGITDIENDKMEIIRDSRVTHPSTFKKTTLKDLFNNFKQPESKRNKTNLANQDTHSNEELTDSKSWKRLHEISKLKNIQSPLKFKQLVEPEEDAIEHRALNLSLKKRMHSAKHSYIFDPIEYHSLNNVKDVKAGTFRTKIACKTSNHTSLWPQLLKPKTLNEIMLDPSLKKHVYKWISEAFVKLKRHTTRNKLLRRQKTDEYDQFDSFIVDDRMDDGTCPKEEFVPLMILFGEGIGKNTLIEVIMETLNGQIYEVNTSSNRAKKDILDTLMEFSTTHYVKGKGSKGIILLDDVDVLFKEHDKFFWQAVEKILLCSRRPIILLCRSINFIPSNIVQLANDEKSLFHAKRVSQQTTTAFLEKYCETLNLTINNSILELLVKCNKKDIRKCLMDLQFFCTPPGEFTVPNATNKATIDTVDLRETVFYADLYSVSDVLESGILWKSSILQEDDPTVMTPDVQATLNSITDDQERLKHDYVVDYRLHLVDKQNQPLLPYELSIGRSLEHELQAYQTRCKIPHLNGDTKLEKMTEATVAYLSTRVINKKNAAELPTRKTRNSKKIREILDRFEGNCIFDDLDEALSFDLELTTKSDLKEQINPYVYEIAKSDAAVKESNRQLFLEKCDGVPKDQYNEIVFELSQQRLFKPIWFRADPKIVIDSWK